MYAQQAILGFVMILCLAVIARRQLFRKASDATLDIILGGIASACLVALLSIWGLA